MCDRIKYISAIYQNSSTCMSKRMYIHPVIYDRHQQRYHSSIDKNSLSISLEMIY